MSETRKKLIFNFVENWLMLLGCLLVVAVELVY